MWEGPGARPGRGVHSLSKHSLAGFEKPFSHLLVRSPPVLPAQLHWTKPEAGPQAFTEVGSRAGDAFILFILDLQKVKRD